MASPRLRSKVSVLTATTSTVIMGCALGATAFAAPSATPLTACNQVITGDVVLTGDLTCSTASAGGGNQGTIGTLNGIIVGADNVTIDLNGHKLIGAAANGFFPAVASTVTPQAANQTQTGAGIVSVGHSGLVIKGGTLSGWITGVRIRSIEGVTPSIGNLVTGITVAGCAVDTRPSPATPAPAATRGIDIAEPGSVATGVKNNTILGNCTQGMRIHEEQGSLVSGNTIRGVGGGNVTTTPSGGIVFDCAGSTDVENNSIVGTVGAVGGYGILVGQTDHSVFKGNKIRQNQADGIRLSLGGTSSECIGDGATSSQNRLLDNEIVGNSGNGIQLGTHALGTTVATPAYANVVSGNQIEHNTGNGVDIALGANEVRDNQFRGNHLAGILAEAPATGDPVNNNGPTTAVNLAGWRGAAGSTLTGNHASGNGTGYSIPGFLVVLTNNTAEHNLGTGFNITGLPPVNSTSPAPVPPATRNANTTPGYCDDSATCSNRIGSNTATGNGGGGLMVTTAAAEYNTDLGGNSGSGNGGPNCVFGASSCLPAQSAVAPAAASAVAPPAASQSQAYQDSAGYQEQLLMLNN